VVKLLPELKLVSAERLRLNWPHMRSSQQPNYSAPRFDPELLTPGNGQRKRSTVPTRVGTPSTYRFCDAVTAAVLYFMVVFSPWAFGTTQSWSIWVMNIGSFLLGSLLITKWLIRWRTGYVPPRWGDSGARNAEFGVRSAESEAVGARNAEQGMRIGTEADSGDAVSENVSGGEVQDATALQRGPESLSSPPLAEERIKARRWTARAFLTAVLALLSVLILVYCFISAANARATYYHDPVASRWVYHDFISWLPHSYDSNSTWFVFWQYLGLAWSFWAIRDWLLGKSKQERLSELGTRNSELETSPAPFRSPHSAAEDQRQETSAFGVPRSASSARSALRTPHSALELPARLRCLLWVLCINGALLGLESILQRLDGTNRLLWLIEPRLNNTSDVQFGPYAYRSNAAQYFNLLWPVCLGFWWMLRRANQRTGHKARRIGEGPQMILLPCAVLLAACPIISITRAGAVIAAVNMVLALVLLIWANRRGNQLMQVGTFCLFLISLVLSGYLAGEKLQKRFLTLFIDDKSGRGEIYQNSWAMARDYPVFGTGPGTFASLYQLYRDPGHTDQEWAGYVHDDWLETLITFGRIGLAAIIVSLLIILTLWRSRGGITSSWVFPSMLLLAMGGCLFHAKFDFPFQIYSVFFLFLVLSGVLTCLSRKA
jgi:O-antigen ligase